MHDRRVVSELEAALTWDDINNTEPITLTEPTLRIFLLEFNDLEGNVASDTIDVVLTCGADGACDAPAWCWTRTRTAARAVKRASATRSAFEGRCTDPCGNGIVEQGEQGDRDNLPGFTCEGLGLSGGTLQCDPVYCTFDTSMCTS